MGEVFLAVSSVHVGAKTIGQGGRCFVIAEAGVNHNGDLKLAKQLVDAAVAAGADAVKFQTFHAEDLVVPNAPKAQYQLLGTDRRESQYAMLKRLELSVKVHQELQEYAERCGIIFLSTPFDNDSIDFLAQLGVPLFKLASGELTNYFLLDHVASKGKPVILSTGMAFLEEVGDAIQVLQGGGCTEIILLHCTTNYPTLPIDCNLRAMVTLGEAFGLTVGYSDHSEGTEIPLAAVALGAHVLEKHLTLDRTLPGPDHQASLDPAGFAALVRGVRVVEASLGDGCKRPATSEQETRTVARRSLVAAQFIPAGTVLAKEHLCAKRPGTGIPPSQFKRLIGRTLRHGLMQDQIVAWTDLE